MILPLIALLNELPWLALPLAEPRLGGARWWGVGLAVLLGALAFWLYRRQLQDATPLRRWLLPSLRALAVTAVALMLAQPSLYSEQTLQQRGQVVVLADASASMGVGDLQATPAHKLLAARALALTDTGGFDWTLHELAQRLVEMRAQAQPAAAVNDEDELSAPPADSADSPSLRERARRLQESAAELASALASLNPALIASAELRGSALMETWTDVPGTRVADVDRQDLFADPPDSSEQVSSLRLPEDAGDDYVRRIRGRLHPPRTGRYRFHLAADTSAELRLSADARPRAMRSLLTVAQRTDRDEFTEPSAGVELAAGEAYAFELRHKEGQRADHLTLAWSFEGGEPVVIEGEALSSPPEQFDPAERRDELASSFAEQVSEPAAALAELPEDQLAAALAELAPALEEWEAQLAALFESYVSAQLDSGQPAAVAAAEAYDGLTRRDRIELLVSESANPRALQPALAERNDIDLRNISGDEDNPTTPTTAPAPDGAPQVAVAAATGTATDLAAALASVQPEEDRPQAVILLSDGRHNAAAGEAPADVAASLGRRGVAVHPVLVGSPRPPRDLAMLEVVGPAAVHREDQVTGRIVLSDTMPPGRPLALEITDGETVLWEKKLETTGRGRREVEFAFEVTDAVRERLPGFDEHGRDGDRRVNELLLPLHVTAAPIDGEMQEGNNLGELPVRVTLGTGRLLILDGRPRWETRYLAALLSRDRRWEVREVLAGTGERRETMPTGEDAFPETREDLFEFDVIVLGEVPVEWWEPEQLQWLTDFVDERGGGLIVIDGLRGELLGYADTPLGKLLPFTPEGGTPVAVERLQLTPAGAERDALRLEPERGRNSELWPELPPPRWVMPSAPLPAADVLVEAITEDGSRLPAIASARVGRGQVWYQAFDEVWRWRKDAEDRWQARYWSGVANRIMEPPFAAEDKYVALGADEAAVEPGAKLGVRARLRNAEGDLLTGDAAAGANATAVLLDEEGRTVAEARLEPDASGGGLFHTDLEAPRRPGSFEVAVRAEGYSPADMTARVGLLVRRPAASGELARLDADDALMRRLAASSGGRFLQEHEAGEVLPELLSELSRERTLRSEYNIWTSWPLFVLVVCLLAVEWAVRRRTGML